MFFSRSISPVSSAAVSPGIDMNFISMRVTSRGKQHEVAVTGMPGNGDPITFVGMASSKAHALAAALELPVDVCAGVIEQHAIRRNGADVLNCMLPSPRAEIVCGMVMAG